MAETGRLPAEEAAAALVAWYRPIARDLPWRKAPTPYHVLLSELMLQQTRVETVIPYFERFVARWPTLEDLASAEPDEVMHAWAGLGYYSRARNLLASAKAAVAAGGLPSDPAALRALPGIGPYTAGAIASIAYGVRAPLVDGNVERVICRLDGLREDPRRAGQKLVWARASALQQALAQGEDPGALNQALMELGATVCTPRNARCDRCPLSEGCVARREGLVEILPQKPAKARPREVRGVAGIAWGPQGFLLGKRPGDEAGRGLLAGLWEPIGCEPEGDETDEEALVKAFRERAGVEVRSQVRLGTVVHVFTHRRLSCAVFEVEIRGEPEALSFYEEARWVSEPSSVPLSTLAAKILRQRSQPSLLAAEPALKP